MHKIVSIILLLCLCACAQAYEPNYKLWTGDDRATIMYHTEISSNSLAWINWTTLDGDATGGVKVQMLKEKATYIIMIVKVDL
jgi:hypothetical protein